MLQEIKKRRIVLASILKPVDDARMYEKMGSTLASEYDVHIIGQPVRQHEMKDSHTVSVPGLQHHKTQQQGHHATWTLNAGGNSTGIAWHPLPSFSRLEVQRLLAPWRVLFKVVTLRPAVLIICTAELLPVALLVRLFTSARIIYDVQENYALNIRLGTVWPRPLRPLMAWCVSFLERCSALVVSKFLLAEESYAKELGFIRDDYYVIENKFIGEAIDIRRSSIVPEELATASDQGVHDRVEREPSRSIKLLFTGTLAETTGVLVAIELAKKLHALSSGVELHIIGYAAQPSIREKLRNAAAEHPFITLTGIDGLVPHSDIREAIRSADFGIIAYPPNESTWHSYPTKLYEYLAMRLPILLVDNPKWYSYCMRYEAAVPFQTDVHQINTSDLLDQMRSRSFYQAVPDDVYWSSEEPKLLEAVSKTLSKV